MILLTLELGTRLIPHSKSNYGRLLTGLISRPRVYRTRSLSITQPRDLEETVKDEGPAKRVPAQQKRKSKTNPATKYKSVAAYLSYAHQGGVSTDSTVFKGNVYELTTLELLQENLWLSNILHQGGAHDRGVDARANWDLNQFKDADPVESPVASRSIMVNSRRIKPLVERKNAESLHVKLFVQCKCYEKTSIDTRMIREINGTYLNNVPERDRSRVFFMIASPNGFTKQGRRDFDNSSNPLIHCQIDKMNIVDTRGSGYDITNYTPSRIRSFYCNPVAEALLKGLDWNLTLKHSRQAEISHRTV
ncbi:unnamed protein product [Kuraishia capsulata CBS 1993]|uniref:Required for respiratory growth protein 7, mitochondrial n=1 Tax=Kuraishia capsulata CBS 1993 TaxID=1382522 RepID=W6MRK0_9ASCO|nr:uncharacterized protein KUCA_T00005369001 [Kuraishia capsulata CBS 1993]CDK29381.1 unnamed protein product [Kuraishia capsulata CBS 1993]